MDKGRKGRFEFHLPTPREGALSHMGELEGEHDAGDVIAALAPIYASVYGLCPKSCANVVPPVRGAVISSLP